MSPGQGRSGPRPTRAKRPAGLARRLTAERLRRQLSQRAAADLVGTTLNTWGRWESGESVPRGRLVLAAVERFLSGQ